ncbi:MAG: DUF4411 family protein [Sphingomonas sp.]|nr:DUF4411 family protein [Sphingomonas sp.]
MGSLLRSGRLSVVWDKLQTLLTSGGAKISKQVHVELCDQDDGAADWVLDCGDAVVEIDEATFAIAQAIDAQFPGWVTKKKNGADPFVIALAESSDLKVITGERQSGSANPKKMKIPDVCLKRGVNCGPLVELIREQGWSF